jgi:uncharacterized protein (TIGR00369 family)
MKDGLMMKLKTNHSQKHKSGADRTMEVSWADPEKTLEALLAIPSSQHIEKLTGSAVSPPPYAELLGFEFMEFSKGYIKVKLIAGEHLYNPLGTVHGGAFASVLDTAASCAVHASLPDDYIYTTQQLSTTFIRPGNASDEYYIAEGRLIHQGRRSAVSEATLHNAAGKLVATATAVCAIIPMKKPGKEAK